MPFYFVSQNKMALEFTPVLQFNMDLIPTWTFPYLIKLSTEIKDEGEIISINLKDKACISIVSLIKSRLNRENSPHSSDELVDMYRIDNISITGVSTLFMPIIINELLSSDPHDLILDHFFGRSCEMLESSPIPI